MTHFVYQPVCQNAGNISQSELEVLLVLCTIFGAIFDNCAIKIKAYQFYLHSNQQIGYWPLLFIVFYWNAKWY